MVILPITAIIKRLSADWMTQSKLRCASITFCNPSICPAYFTILPSTEPPFWDTSFAISSNWAMVKDDIAFKMASLALFWMDAAKVYRFFSTSQRKVVEDVVESKSQKVRRIAQKNLSTKSPTKALVSNYATCSDFSKTSIFAKLLYKYSCFRLCIRNVKLWQLLMNVTPRTALLIMSGAPFFVLRFLLKKMSSSSLSSSLRIYVLRGIYLCIYLI